MQKNTVCLTMEDAKQIYELFNTCALADLHYHTCQSELFRRHVCSTYKAANVVYAFDRLKAMINSSTEQAEKKGE